MIPVQGGKEVIRMAEKKQDTCGCGCLPVPKTGSKTSRPDAEKLKKPKK